MNSSSPTIADLQAGVARLDQLTRGGFARADLRRDERSGRATRIHRGVYQVRDQALGTQHDVTAMWAAHLHLGPESVLVLRSALELHGIQGVIGAHDPQIAMPPGLEKEQRAGLDIHFWEIPAEQRTVMSGLPVTTVLRTLADSLLALPRMQAVSIIDSAIHLGLISPSDFSSITAIMRGRRGCVRGRIWLAESSPGAQSPLETRVRLRATDGGLPPDALQVPVLDRLGRVLGYGDMGYRLPDGSWLIVEADGRSIHEQPEAILNDRHRQNAFLALAAASIIRFTWEDTVEPSTIPSVLQLPLQRAGWKPPALR